jgi:hypothetical protein
MADTSPKSGPTSWPDLSISAYPFWSLAVFTLDILVVYGLAAYGGDPRVVE